MSKAETVRPTLIPSYGLIGQRQEFVIEYPYDLPSGTLMTLAIFREGQPICPKIPTNPLGPRAGKAFLPAFQAGGIYIIIPKFPAQEHPNYPPFELRVLTSVEALMQALTPEDNTEIASVSQNSRAVLAALLAFHIQREQQGIEESRELMDEILTSIFPSLDNPVISIVQFLCGKYSEREETLLHFCIRHQYLKMCKIISEPYGYDYHGFERSLTMSGFDGKTPLELSEMFNMKFLSSLIEAAMEPSYADETPYDFEIEKTSETKRRVKRKFDKIRNAIKKKQKSKHSLTDDDIEEGIITQSADISTSLLNQLKITALYSAKVIAPYSGMDKQFGPVTLKVDDVVFVTREEDAYWCTGLVNDSYRRFPRNVLQCLSYQKATETIPAPKDLISPDVVCDFEDLQGFVDEHKKYVSYKDSQKPVATRFSYLSPVTHSCSVESGLDKIVNHSPGPQRKQLPPLSPKNSYRDHNTRYGRGVKEMSPSHIPGKGISRKGTPLPVPPRHEQDSSDDSSSDYEKADLLPPAERMTEMRRPFGSSPSQGQPAVFARPNLDPVKINTNVKKNLVRINVGSPSGIYGASAGAPPIPPSVCEQDDESDQYDTVGRIPWNSQSSNLTKLQQIRKKVERNATSTNTRTHHEAADRQLLTDPDEESNGYTVGSSISSTNPLPKPKPKPTRQSTDSRDRDSAPRSTSSRDYQGATTSATSSITEKDEYVSDEYDDLYSLRETYQLHRPLPQTNTTHETYKEEQSSRNSADSFYSEKRISTVSDDYEDTGEDGPPWRPSVVPPPAVKEKPKRKQNQWPQPQQPDEIPINEQIRQHNKMYAPQTPPILKKPLPAIPKKQEASRYGETDRALKSPGPIPPLPLKSPDPKQPMVPPPPPLRPSVPKVSDTDHQTASSRESLPVVHAETKKRDESGKQGSIKDRINMFESN